jgi:hypothetical protein
LRVRAICNAEESEFPFRIGSRENGCWAYSLEGRELILFEWKNYWLDADNAENVVIPGLPKSEIEKYPPADNVFEFIFKNYIGKSRLIIDFQDGSRMEFPVTVLSEKLAMMKGILNVTEEYVPVLIDTFNKFAEKLTGDISRMSLALNFSIESPTVFTVEEGDEPVNELFAYHYFKYNRDRIPEAFETVMNRIKRKLVLEEGLLDLHDVDEVNLDMLVSILHHPEYLVKARDRVLIAKYLKGHTPTKVLGYRRYETEDTPENRFVKYFLNLLIEWSQRVLDTSMLNNNRDGEAEFIEFLNELEFIATNPLWDEVGEMTLFPYSSRILLKGDGYRDLLQLYREFTAYIPFFSELQRAIDNKDIATLYEYWVFFRLVEKLGEILSLKRSKIYVNLTGELSDKGNVYAEFENGWRLYYNRKLTPKRWSYTVSLRPDFSLFNGNPDSLNSEVELIGVFDAKFKLDIVGLNSEDIEEFDEYGADFERTANYETWAKLEDIYKMHTYKDALGCKFAVAIYPGINSIFWKSSKENVENFTLMDLLDEYGVKLTGIGYISFNLLNN